MQYVREDIMVSNNVYICADVHYPHGDAGSNRVHYVACAIKASGRNVLVIACGKRTEEKESTHAGVRYVNIKKRTGRITSVIDEQIKNGWIMLEELKQQANAGDYVYIYGSNSLFMYPIMHYCRKQGIKIIVDVVEWHQPYQYKYGKLDMRYISNNHAFRRMSLKAKNIVAISKLIGNFYQMSNCNVLIMPMIIDTAGVVWSQQYQGPIINMIYPGNPNREDFVTMLKAMLALKEEDRNRLRMNITGAFKGKVREKLGANAVLLDELENIFVFHGWLDYDQLTTLFLQMDCIFMSRPDDLVKQANFPSKIPEMMARGVFPVCNRVGDYCNYMTNGTDSIVFDVDTVEDCKHALVRLLSMTEQELIKMKQETRKTAEKWFDYRCWVKTLDRFFECTK